MEIEQTNDTEAYGQYLEYIQKKSKKVYYWYELWE